MEEGEEEEEVAKEAEEEAGGGPEEEEEGEGGTADPDAGAGADGERRHVTRRASSESLRTIRSEWSGSVELHALGRVGIAEQCPRERAAP